MKQWGWDAHGDQCVWCLGERRGVASIFAAVEKAAFEQAVSTMGLVGKSETLEHLFAIRIRRDGDPKILYSLLQSPKL